MQTLAYINPIKIGKTEDYKIFMREYMSNKDKYINMLKRYSLINTKVWFHKLGNRAFVIVVHDAEDNAPELLAKFSTSTHPYDQWFLSRLVALHDMEEVGSAEQWLNFTY